MDPIHQELLRQAVEAAKVGDMNSAITKVKEVLEEDEANAKAWMLLARLTTNNDEKRIALATLLQIEPNNTKAKELLAKLDTQVNRPTNPSDGATNPNRSRPDGGICHGQSTHRHLNPNTVPIRNITPHCHPHRHPNPCTD